MTVSIGIFTGYEWNAGGIWKGDVIVGDIEELEILDALEIHARRLNAKEVLRKKRVNILYSRSQMEQQDCVEEITKSENPLCGENNL